MAAPALAPAAAAPTAANTRVTPISAGAANALAADDLDMYDVSRDNLMAAALKCTAVARPQAPAAHKVPRYELQGLWLSAVLFDLDDGAVQATLKASNIVEHEMRHGDISALNLEAARAGLFGKAIKQYPDLANSVCASSAFDRSARTGGSARASAVTSAADGGNAGPIPPPLLQAGDRIEVLWGDEYFAGAFTSSKADHAQGRRLHRIVYDRTDAWAAQSHWHDLAQETWRRI